MSKKNKMDKVLKNMEYLIKELQKEWDESKETKHTIMLSVDQAKVVRTKLQEHITYISVKCLSMMMYFRSRRACSFASRIM